MEKDLLQTAALDLGIVRYSSESESQFNNRVIYSALACWIKAACQDHLAEHERSEGVSRRHIYDKCTRILNAFLCRYHSSEPWFNTDDTANNAVALIRTRLLRHQDILNTGFNTNIAMPAVGYELLSHNLEAIRGVLLAPGCQYNGIAMTRKPQNPVVEPIANMTFESQWLEEYVNTAWWEPFSISQEESLEYFDAHKKVANMYLCWQATMPKAAEKFIIVRRPVNVNSHEYILVNTHSKKMHRIDPVLKELGEHRRFMFALRAAANNHVIGKVAVFAEHVHLKMRTYLPVKETHLLEAFAWPHNSITDRLEWDMSISVWEYICPFLTALGMTFREDEHG